MIKRLFHWVAHKTGQNEGRVVTWQENGFIWVGFECSTCKTIDPTTVDKIEEEKVLGKPIIFDEE